MLKQIAITLLTLAMFTGCRRQADPTDTTAARTLTLYTTIAPIHYVTGRLLGGMDTIISTVPAGEDEAEYIPDRSVLMDMVNADLIILNGASFEEWLDAVTLPDSLLFDSAHVYRDQWLVYEGIVHSHGELDDHSHEGYNGHTWLAPYFFQKQVTAIYEKLKTLLTEDEQQKRNLSENYQALHEQLTALNAKGRDVFSPLQGTTLAATHPTYDYVAKSYGFAIFNIDIDPDAEEISEHIQGELDRLKQKQEETNITFLLWEEEPSEVLVQATARLNLINIVFPPLAGMDDPDYITGMKETFKNIADIISSAQP